MADGEHSKGLDDRRLSIVVFSLFFSWMLAFPFEGQILYSLADLFNLVPDKLVLGAVAMHFAGLFLCGFWIRDAKAAKRLMLVSIVFCFLVSGVFFLPPSILWTAAILSGSFLASGCVAAWGFYFKSTTLKNERIKTAADGLIFSNILMIFLDMAAIHLSAYVGLGLSMLVLLAAFLFALRLPADIAAVLQPVAQSFHTPVSIKKPLAFLCLFIVVITVNSGLMYQVMIPAFANLQWLTSWYWAVPYIAALWVMKNLPRKTNRTYLLYVAIAMIGFSFIAFMILDRSAGSYLIVDTLMLGACGVYDLFWWSILGEMLDFHKNPALVLGFGLSANVMGVLLGGLIGTIISATETSVQTSSALALAVVCITLVILPPLNSHLSALLKNHVYLVALSEMPPDEQNEITGRYTQFETLSERERQVAGLLLQGKTYRTIAGELYISENTVKYYVKNIYSKFNIRSRTELIDMALKQESAAPTK